MKIAVFTGTFDPPTLGHLEIIERASGLFDKLYIAVAEDNVKKKLALPYEERLELMRVITTDIRNVEVVGFSGLAVDCTKEVEAGYLVRGVRNGSDLDFEMQMATANRQMTGVETVVFFASPQHCHLSSTLIREIGAGGHRLHGFVPAAIEERVYTALAIRD